MAHILIVEDSNTAMLTLKTYLKKAGYAVQSKTSVNSAWKALKKNPCIDLVILDLSLDQEDGFELLKRIRTDLILEKLPVLIYTINTRRDSVIKVLNCGIQNYLLKPAKPEQILDEAKKAQATAWRQAFFTDFSILTREFAYNHSEYVVLLSDAKESLIECEQRMLASIANGKSRLCFAHLKRLKQNTRTIGCHILNSILTDLALLIQQGDYSMLKQNIQNLRVIQTIIDEKIATLVHSKEPSAAPSAESNEPTEDILLEKIESLENLPAFGNLAQSFKEATQSIDIDVDRVVAIINRDPCLASQVISFANSAYVASHHEIDDVEMAVQQLGYRRIQFIALSITPPHPSQRVFTAFDWRSFWTRQVGCACVCQKIVEELNAPPLPQAYLAGLLHGIGQIIISNYFPHEYAKAVKYANEYKLALSEAEREFFGISHEAIGAKYAHNHNFPHGLEAAIRYQHHPEEAETYQELAAVLNIAAFLCNKYAVGTNGMPPVSPYVVTLNKLPAWTILKEWAVPRMAVENFEARMERHIRTIKAETDSFADQLTYLEPV